MTIKLSTNSTKEPSYANSSRASKNVPKSIVLVPFALALRMYSNSRDVRSGIPVFIFANLQKPYDVILSVLPVLDASI